MVNITDIKTLDCWQLMKKGVRVCQEGVTTSVN
jgi:hypothetical protein